MKNLDFEQIISRIKQVSDSMELTQTRIAEITGYSAGSVSGYFSGSVNFNRKAANTFASSFEKQLNISPAWLLEGKGEMLLTDQAITPTNEKGKEHVMKELVKMLMDQNSYLLGRVKELESLLGAEAEKKKFEQ